jgi:glycosyltransferase involved in cell wall biosynthesis
MTGIAVEAGPGPRREVVVIGPTSRRAVTGLSTAFDTLVQELRDRAIPHRVIDSAPADPRRGGGGTVSLLRTAEVLGVVGRAWVGMRRTGTLYMTMGGSAPGVLRDFLIVHMASVLGVRTVLHYHGGGYDEFYRGTSPTVRRLIRSMLGRVDTLIVLGELLRDQFSFQAEQKRPRICVVPNGLSVESGTRPRTRALSTNGRISLLYLSNLIPSKGYLLLVEATGILRQRGLDVECHLAGEFIAVGRGADSMDVSSARRELQDRIRSLDLVDAITYHGPVHGEAKWRILEDADVFVLPTQYPGEGQPISVIEALSRGIPVVASRYRGIPEQVETGLNGWLIDPVTPETIADAIAKVVGTAESYSRLSMNARRVYEEKFTRRQYVDRLVGVILDTNTSAKTALSSPAL